MSSKIVSVLVLGALFTVGACSHDQAEQGEAVAQGSDTSDAQGAAAADAPADSETVADAAGVEQEQAADTAVAGAAALSQPAAPAAPEPAPAASSAPAVTESNAKPLPSGSYLWVFSDRAIVRQGPSQTSAKVGKVPYGERVEALAESGGYIKIGEGRWVKKSALTDRKARFTPHSNKKMAH